MRKITSAAFCIIMIAAAAGAALALPSPRGKVASITLDGVLTVDTGMDVGFEMGDILVIQRHGQKVALAHVSQITHNTATANVIRTEDGEAVKVGDVAAYQLLSNVVSDNWTGPRTLQEPTVTELPDIMRREWQAPDITYTNLDKIIDDNHAILEKQPYNRNAMLTLADTYFKKGWYDHSILWSQKAIENNPTAEDTDKLLYQIIRCFGFLNQPQKQALYIQFLNKNYPNSVFAAIDYGVQPVQGASLLEFNRGVRNTITDLGGMQKSGMSYYEPGLTDVYGRRIDGTYSQPYPNAPAPVNIGTRLLHANPNRLAPQTYEPDYYYKIQKYYDNYNDPNYYPSTSEDYYKKNLNSQIEIIKK